MIFINGFMRLFPLISDQYTGFAPKPPVALKAGCLHQKSVVGYFDSFRDKMY